MNSLLKNQILKPLSRFTKNLNPDRLHVSALKGEGELHNLELNESALIDLLDLPTWLNIKKAVVNHVQVKIQWTKLKSQPIMVFLDEVLVEIEALDEPRPLNPNAVPSYRMEQGGKYGFIDRVIDGIKMSVNVVRIVFTAQAFNASLELSRLVVASKMPNWKDAEELKLTAVRDASRDCILLFKEIFWETTRIEANGLQELQVNPVKLITNTSRIRITLKKRLSDCAVICSRVQFLLDDLLWVLTISQMEAAILFMKSLKKSILKSSQQSKAQAEEKLKRQQGGDLVGSRGGAASSLLQQHQQQQQASSQRSSRRSSNEPTPSPAQSKSAQLSRLFDYYNVPETSYHFFTGRIELHLCEEGRADSKLSSHAVFNGAIRCTFQKIHLDFYPFHLHNSSKEHWLGYKDLCKYRNKWVESLLKEFWNEKQQQQQTDFNNDISTSTTSSSQQQQQQHYHSSSNYSFSHSPNTSPSPPSTSSPVLMESSIVVRLEDFQISTVSTTVKRRGGPANKAPIFIGSDKARLKLPEDTVTVFLDLTEFYYTDEKLKNQVPPAKIFCQLNPVHLYLDYETVIWLNAFYLNLSKNMCAWSELVPLEQAKDFSGLAHVRLEALMPRAVFPAEYEVSGQPERPTSIQAIASTVTLQNILPTDNEIHFQALEHLINQFIGGDHNNTTDDEQPNFYSSSSPPPPPPAPSTAWIKRFYQDNAGRSDPRLQMHKRHRDIQQRKKSSLGGASSLLSNNSLDWPSNLSEKLTNNNTTTTSTNDLFPRNSSDACVNWNVFRRRERTPRNSIDNGIHRIGQTMPMDANDAPSGTTNTTTTTTDHLIDALNSIIWRLNCDPIWLEYIGAKSGLGKLNARPQTFIEPVPLTVWAHVQYIPAPADLALGSTGTLAPANLIENVCQTDGGSAGGGGTHSRSKSTSVSGVASNTVLEKTRASLHVNVLFDLLGGSVNKKSGGSGSEISSSLSKVPPLQLRINHYQLLFINRLTDNLSQLIEAVVADQKEILAPLCQPTTASHSAAAGLPIDLLDEAKLLLDEDEESASEPPSISFSLAVRVHAMHFTAVLPALAEGLPIHESSSMIFSQQLLPDNNIQHHQLKRDESSELFHPLMTTTTTSSNDYDVINTSASNDILFNEQQRDNVTRLTVFATSATSVNNQDAFSAAATLIEVESSCSSSMRRIHSADASPKMLHGNKMIDSSSGHSPHPPGKRLQIETPEPQSYAGTPVKSSILSPQRNQQLINTNSPLQTNKLATNSNSNPFLKVGSSFSKLGEKLKSTVTGGGSGGGSGSLDDEPLGSDWEAVSIADSDFSEGDDRLLAMLPCSDLDSQYNIMGISYGAPSNIQIGRPIITCASVVEEGFEVTDTSQTIMNNNADEAMSIMSSCTSRGRDTISTVTICLTQLECCLSLQNDELSLAILAGNLNIVESGAVGDEDEAEAASKTCACHSGGPTASGPLLALRIVLPSAEENKMKCLPAEITTDNGGGPVKKSLHLEARVLHSLYLNLLMSTVINLSDMIEDELVAVSDSQFPTLEILLQGELGLKLMEDRPCGNITCPGQHPPISLTLPRGFCVRRDHKNVLHLDCLTSSKEDKGTMTTEMSPLSTSTPAAAAATITTSISNTLSTTPPNINKASPPSRPPARPPPIGSCRNNSQTTEFAPMSRGLPLVDIGINTLPPPSSQSIDVQVDLVVMPNLFDVACQTTASSHNISNNSNNNSDEINQQQQQQQTINATLSGGSPSPPSFPGPGHNPSQELLTHYYQENVRLRDKVSALRKEQTISLTDFSQLQRELEETRRERDCLMATLEKLQCELTNRSSGGMIINSTASGGGGAGAGGGGSTGVRTQANVNNPMQFNAHVLDSRVRNSSGGSGSSSSPRSRHS